MTAVRPTGIHLDRGAFAALILGVLMLCLWRIAPAVAAGDVRAHADAHEHDPHAHHRVMAESAGRYGRSEHFYRIPDVTLIDMAGSKVSLASALDGDSPVLLDFIFTSCTSICPVLSATFSQFQNHIGHGHDKVRMISISIDPEHDSPETLKTYARKFNAGPQWQFLTGSVADIVAVQKAFDAWRGNKMGHQPFTFLRASADAPWVRLDGFASATDLVAEYRRAVSK
jgi:protein SCO1/2